MERPILFSGEMVRAILAGRKTQTRRVVRGVGAADYAGATWVADGDLYTPARDELCRGCLDAIGPAVRCPYGVPGDRLWVRETWCQQACMVHGDLLPGKAHYRADGYEVRHVDGPGKSPWRSPLFMPRWASRITLEVTAVRVERLQDITEEDARAEGVEPTVMVAAGVPEREVLVPAVGVYRNLWDRINGKRHPWASNPWVWVVSFRRAVA